MANMCNVTVKATGVTCPMGSPATGQLTTITATLFIGNVQAAGPQDMTPTGNQGEWATTFISQPTGKTYKATVNATWQITDTESATSAGYNCNC
jgi:hypothetical protein